MWAAGLGAEHADSGVPALVPTLGHLTRGRAKASGSHAGSSNGVADAKVRPRDSHHAPTWRRCRPGEAEAPGALLRQEARFGKRRCGGQGLAVQPPRGRSGVCARSVVGGSGGSSVMPAALEAARGTDPCPAVEAPANSAHTKDLYRGGPVRSVKTPGAHAPGLNANSLGEPGKLYPPPQFAVGTDAQMVGEFVQSHCPSPGHLQAQ